MISLTCKKEKDIFIHIFTCRENIWKEHHELISVVIFGIQNEENRGWTQNFYFLIIYTLTLADISRMSKHYCYDKKKKTRQTKINFL